MSEKIRINKYLSKIGFCSRRKADEYINLGKIKVNNIEATLGDKVNEEDLLEFEGRKIDNEANPKKVYLAFNKPTGVVCTTDSGVEKNNVVDFINYPTRIYPIGRLDKLSEGLLLLTNDGEIVNTILKANEQKEKEYIVTVSKPITQEFIDKMSKGVFIIEKKTSPCVVKQLHKKKFKIILTQGMNRQIRRMCEVFDYRVLSLKRVRIMHISLGKLGTGKWRELTASEVEEIKA